MMRSRTVRLALAVAAGVGAAGSVVALLATSAWLIARASQQPPMLTLMVAIVGVRTFGIGRGVLRYVERLLSHDAAFRIQADLRVSVVRRLSQLVPGVAQRSGDLLSRLVSDTDAVLDRIVRVALPVTAAAIVGAATAALFALILPAAGAAVAVVVGVALLVIPALTRWVARRSQRRLAPLRGELAATVSETLDAVPELVAYDATDRALDRVTDVDRRLRTAEGTTAWSNGLGTGLLVLAVGAASVAGLAFGLAQGLSIELLAVVVLGPLALADVLGGTPQAAGVADRAKTAQHRIDAVLESEPPVVEPVDPRPLPEPPYDIRIEGLGVRTLHDVSLDLPAGSRAVFSGPSGFGKTSLLHVLVRFLEPSEGRVTLNGIDIREFAGDDVRRIVKLCEQQPHVFDSTLADNLRIARPDATDDELRSALRKARLTAWESRLDTRVGVHGERMSGGERQRLGIARVLLADAPIVLYDEPTEHLEADTAAAIERDLLEASTGRTVLLTALESPR